MNVIEPKDYEGEYFDSKKPRPAQILGGLIIAGSGVFALYKGQNIFVVLVIILVGIFVTYRGFTGWAVQQAKLKLAKQGLWTSKLGFVEWGDISSAQVIQDESGKSEEYILEIFLKQSSVKTGGHQPDERLYITKLENYQYVEMQMETLMNKHRAGR